MRLPVPAMTRTPAPPLSDDVGHRVVAAAGFDQHPVPGVAGDDVARALVGAADDVVDGGRGAIGGIGGAQQMDAAATIGNRVRARGIGANQVPWMTFPSWVPQPGEHAIPWYYQVEPAMEMPSLPLPEIRFPAPATAPAR